MKIHKVYIWTPPGWEVIASNANAYPKPRNDFSNLLCSYVEHLVASNFGVPAKQVWVLPMSVGPMGWKNKFLIDMQLAADDKYASDEEIYATFKKNIVDATPQLLSDALRGIRYAMEQPSYTLDVTWVQGRSGSFDSSGNAID